VARGSPGSIRTDRRGRIPQRLSAFRADRLPGRGTQHLGVDPEAQYLNATGRPIPVLPSGKPIDELM